MTDTVPAALIGADRLRYKLVLGKFRVEHVIQTGDRVSFDLIFPGLGKMILTAPIADVREGDLLTLYTEILSNAQSK